MAIIIIIIFPSLSLSLSSHFNFKLKHEMHFQGYDQLSKTQAILLLYKTIKPNHAKISRRQNALVNELERAKLTVSCFTLHVSLFQYVCCAMLFLSSCDHSIQIKLGSALFYLFLREALNFIGCVHSFCYFYFHSNIR